MAHKQEIERKFLVQAELLPPLSGGARLAQGYLATQPTVRVRAESGPGARCGYLTIKGEGLIGRDEFEYAIPFDEAEALLQLGGAVVSKTRYELPVEGRTDLKWELDIFDGDNDGLIVAEIELPDAAAAFPRPAWLGMEVTEDPAYKNASLAQRPYGAW